MATKYVVKKAAEKPAQPTLEDVENVVRIEAPCFYASAASVQATANEFMLALSKARPTTDKRTGSLSQVGLLEPVAIINVSPQTAKDLGIMLVDAVKRFEKAHGSVNTPYSLQMEKSGKEKAKDKAKG